MKPATLLTLQNLKPCRIIKRDTRFTVKVSLNGREELALLRNTGRLHDLIYHDAPALCTPRPPGGKTRYLLVGVSIAGSSVALIDPKIQCEAFEQASSRGLIPWLRDWHIDRTEVVVEDSRIDYSIRSVTGEQGFLETKSAVHFTGYYAMYPDCPSERGRRHIRVLRDLRRRGHRSVLTFIAAHPSAEAFTPDIESDPKLASELLHASQKGVEVYAVKMSLDKASVVLMNPQIPVYQPDVP